MQKPLSERHLRKMIKSWRVGVNGSDFNDEIIALLDLCRYVEKEHGIVKETPKEHSKDPVQLELNMWL